jgi:hypothetical protein
MNSAERETTYYNQGNVRVTTSRFIVGEQTYSLGQITSVKTEKIPPKTGCWALLMVVCGLGGLLALIAGFVDGSTSTIFSGTAILGLAVLIFFAIQGSKDTYAVQITTSAGETSALKDRDPAKIRPVVEAINEAMIDRG